MTLSLDTSSYSTVTRLAGFDETNDCVVRAFSLALNRPYAEVHALCKAKGRLDLKGTSHSTVEAVTYLKAEADEPRTMLCRPLEVNADATKRYATVWDIEAEGYRRVNLDTIIKLSLETHSHAHAGEQA